MRLIDDLAGNGAVLRAVAEAGHISVGEARNVVAGVVPELANAMERNTLSRGGLAEVVAFMGRGAPERLLDEPEWITDPALSNRVNDYGIAALDLMLGSRDASRAIADRVARTSGVDAAAIRALLPSIAALSIAGMKRDTQAAFGDIFRRHPGIDDQSSRGSSGDYGGGAASNSGSGVELPGGGTFPDQSPLPLPGELPRGGYDDGGYGGGNRQAPHNQGESGGRTPYDDLSDILRRGGFGGGRPAGGGTTINVPGGSGEGGLLWSIVRQLLGAVLGFQSRGLVGWIIRAVVMRYGWQILQTVLRRVLTGR